MGNRALVVFVNKHTPRNRAEGVCHVPAVYLHWNGNDVRDWLRETRECMAGRPGDAEYTRARFCGIAHAHIPGNLSLGLTTCDVSEPAQASPGDAGVFVVDVSQPGWHVTNYDGNTSEGAFSGEP
jgi:hypothetical protein